MAGDAINERPLRRALERLATLAVVPQAGEALRGAARKAEEALRKAVLDEVPGFSDSRNPQVLPELKDHSRDHVVELIRLFEGGDVGDFEFVRAHARRRAEQRFPLETTLHAYRCGHRAMARWLRDAAAATNPKRPDDAVAAVADFAIEYTNAISAAMTSEYVEAARTLAAAERDQSVELLTTLLGGYDESDGRIARLLRANGYLDQRQTYCVVVMRAALISEMESPERAQRIIASLQELVAPTNIRALAGPRAFSVVAVMSALRRQSGWTAPQSLLAERLDKLLQPWGPAILAGVSADHPSTSSIPRADREAAIALEFASLSRRIVMFSALPTRSLLLHAGGEYVRAALPAWTADFIAADAKAGGALMATLSALADADLNIQQAARALALHPNTIYARLKRIRDLTGLDGGRHRDLVELMLSVDAARG